MSGVKNSSQTDEKVSTIDSNVIVDEKSLLHVEKAFCGYPRSSHGFFALHGKSRKGSFTDKTKYIPLYQSVMNLQQGKSISGSGSVNLVSSNDFEFPDGKVPARWKPTDSLLSMDIADISQMQRELAARISEIERTIKSSEEKQNLILIKDSVKNQKKISDSLLSSIADSALSDTLKKYNSTIQ